MKETIIRPLKGKSSLSVLWLISTFSLCVIFVLASVPAAEAQGRDQEARRYTSVIQNVFDFIQQHYVETVDPQVLFEGAMSGMFNALGDPYSAFLPEKEMASLNETTQGSFGGVGLYISKPIGDQAGGPPPYVEVASPIEDTPGWRAGISPGDLIIKINDESTDVLTMDEVLARLRGTPGVAVNLIIRRGAKLEFPVTLIRAVIEVPTVKYAMIGDIGYVRIITFTPMTVERTREALEHFKTENARSLVVDLRNNYGGLLQSAVGVCDLFLDGGVVVSTRSRIPGENAVFNARKATAIPTAMPIVTLINRGSASASEIVAGALKDRGRAYLVGEKSFGKGSVQQVYPLEKAGFKITTARYYTPSEVNIDQIGIPPDREILFPEFSDAEAEKLNALITENRIPAFVEANPQAASAAVEAFVRQLNQEYQLDLALLRRLVRNEQNRTLIAPVYDLEYDVQLQEAVNILRNGDYGRLMQTTKTLKDLQNEAITEDARAS
ncbi:S41 family peptidase [Treponema sp. TIM-1]|uniref:S41 family peptidase n=1 Tax=Treponema sp. TIM-1 TaxID=2898417 RepID=UPI00397F6866